MATLQGGGPTVGATRRMTTRGALAVLVVCAAAAALSNPIEVVVLTTLPASSTEYAAAADIAALIANADPATNATLRLRVAHAPSGGVPLGTVENICNAPDAQLAAVILGPLSSSDALFAAALGQLNGLPVVSFSATSPDLGSSTRYPTFVRLVPSDGVIASAAVALLRSFNVSRGALLHSDDAYGLGGAAAVAAAAAAAHLELVVQAGFELDSSFTGLPAALAAVKAAAAKWVVVWCVQAVCGGVLSAAAGAGLLDASHVWVLAAEPDVPTFAPLNAASILSVVPARGGGGAGTVAAALLAEFLAVWGARAPATLPAAPSVYDNYLYDAMRTIQYAAAAAIRGGWRPAGAPLQVSCFSGARQNTSLPVASLRGVQPFAGITGTVAFTPRSCERTAPGVAMNMYINGSGFTYLVATSAGGAQTPPAPRVLWPGGTSTPPPDNAVLAGRVLRALTTSAPPFVNVAADGSVSGIVPDMVAQLQAQLNFRVVWTAYSNMTYDKMLAEVNKSHFDCFLGRTQITTCVSVQTRVGMHAVFYLTHVERSHTRACRARTSVVLFSTPYFFDTLRTCAPHLCNYFISCMSLRARAFRPGRPAAPGNPDRLPQLHAAILEQRVARIPGLYTRVRAVLLLVRARFERGARGRGSRPQGGATLLQVRRVRARCCRRRRRSSSSSSGPGRAHYLTTSSLPCGTLRSLWHVVLGFLGSDTGLRAATLAGRLLVVAMQFTALIVVATYTGSVASSLTAKVSLSAFSGIDDIKSGVISPLRVGVRPGTAQAAWYTNAVGAGLAVVRVRECIHRARVHAAQLNTQTFYPIGDTNTGFDALRAGVIDAFVATDSGIQYEIHHDGYCDGLEAGCATPHACARPPQHPGSLCSQCDRGVRVSSVCLPAWPQGFTVRHQLRAGIP